MKPKISFFHLQTQKFGQALFSQFEHCSQTLEVGGVQK
jgi:hypothetical protein